MYYTNLLKDLISTNRDSVTKMYLYEINMKWTNFMKGVEESIENGSNVEMVNGLNDFISAISNKKFHYNSRTRKGFPKDSPLFSSIYLDDLVSIFITKSKVTENRGLEWGYQKFSTNVRYNPANLSLTNSGLNFEKGESSELLQLSVTIENQFRIKGTRNFRKNSIVLPLLTFFNFNTLSKKQYINVEHYASLAKETFHKAKSIIVCESLEKDFLPKLKNSNIDAVVVLRKEFIGKTKNEIGIDAVNMLEKKINEFLYSSSELDFAFKQNGLIE